MGRSLLRSLTRNICLAALVVGMLIGVAAAGSSFWDAPPTRGLYRPTAYVLGRGETQIQIFSISAMTNPLAFLEFEYGLSDVFQLGTRPVALAFGDVRLFGKYHVGTTGPVSLAMPFTVELLIPTLSGGATGGWVLSWRVLPLLTLHPGLDMPVFPVAGIHPYLGVDLDLLPDLKLVVEVDGSPPYVDLGVLARFFGLVTVQVDFTLPWSGLHLSISVRF